jgi:hypothetical protein
MLFSAASLKKTTKKSSTNIEQMKKKSGENDEFCHILRKTERNFAEQIFTLKYFIFRDIERKKALRLQL